MALEMFNVVLVGDNFPLATLKVEDFSFNHRELKETVRVPVLLQAEARSVHMQMMPDRFEATVVDSKNPLDEARHLSSMVEQLFEYTGPKSVRAVGHNAQYIIAGTEGKKREALSGLVDFGAASGLLGTPADEGDLHLYFSINNQSRARLAILSQVSECLALDVNVNYDTTSGCSARDAVGLLERSIEEVLAIAARCEKALGRVDDSGPW